MDIETRGLGAGSYPEPPEEKTKNVKVTLTVTVKHIIEVPENWDEEAIKEDIKENMDEYLTDSMLEDWEVDIDG